jgi:Ca2+-binding EF-hand superfamily protein
MQSYAEGIHDAVWSKLEGIFKRYAGNKTYIGNDEIEKVVTEVLHENSRAEIDYVMKNLFRLDSDNNGFIDMPEFGNFLLNRHCG